MEFICILACLLVAMALSGGDWLSLREAAKSIPGRPHISTLFRWISSGVRGVRLRSKLVGGRRYVDPQSLADFIEHVTAAADDDPLPARLYQRDVAITAAERALDQEGV